ncbi:hypothetical protein L6164_012707 [Bauhinia variegata]|uniref:Uncharacterized protein n=1 Tax=Bauhinia variegata TaxID=167791 RepID=A0ACB9PDQ0_BAUVA|nr:hypothetical protein L6164_012707 [Bauhinia variegata]
MFCFLCKTIVSQTRRYGNPICPTTTKVLLIQKQWFSPKSKSSSLEKQSITVSYLINTCGFSPEEAASTSKYMNLVTREKADSVIKFLENQGFSRAQALRVIRVQPVLLRYDAEKTFLPKIEFLKSRGILNSEIFQIIVNCPDILKRSLEKRIIPSFDFFTDLFQSEGKFIEALRRYSGFIVDFDIYIAPNIKTLRDEGVPECQIMKLLEKNPRSLRKNPDQFKNIVEQVKKMGFDPLARLFCIAVAVMAGISKSTWERKVQILNKWGWSENEILAAFRKNPGCMMISEEKIDVVMEFFVNKMGFEPSVIARRPIMVSMSLDKRIIPRASVVQVLLSKGLLHELNLSAIFDCTERDFLKRFVLPHEKEADELLKLYQAKLDHAR